MQNESLQTDDLAVELIMAKRTLEERQIIRDWALENGLVVASHGAVSQKTIDAWIAAHNHLTPMAIRQWRWEKGILRQVEILCYKCARIHYDYVTPSERLGEITTVHVKCWEMDGMHYTYIDTLPITKWELDLNGQQ